MSRKAKILLVEDEPGVAEVGRKRLEVSGYEVLLARNGPEGLAKAQQEQPDLIVLDVMLPGLNGYEICTMLKQDTRYQRIPIILLTARAQGKDKDLGMECGADAYLTKPCKGEDLIAQIQTLLPNAPTA